MNLSTPRSSKPNAGGSIPSRRADHTDPPWAARFWAKVNRNGPIKRPELGPCWEWTASRFPRTGYGRFKTDTRPGASPARAHRASYELAHGPIPDDQVVRHRCDNPPCCNPAHLLLGTQAENINDGVERGRIDRRWMSSPGSRRNRHLTRAVAQ